MSELQENFFVTPKEILGKELDTEADKRVSLVDRVLSWLASPAYADDNITYQSKDKISDALSLPKLP